MLLVYVPVLLFSAIVKSETTTTTYDINIPQSNPIRIIEGESLWTEKTRNAYRYENDENSPFYKDDRKYEPEALEHFLTRYAENVYKNQLVKQPEEETKHIKVNTVSNGDIYADKFITNEGQAEKPKSWSLVHYQKHNHPYDDKKGWVSMEPVPWSISKISKWQTSQKADDKLWQDDRYPSNYYDDKLPNKPLSTNYYEDKLSKPSWPGQTLKPYQSNYDSNGYKSYYTTEKASTLPIFTKPMAIYEQKVHLDYKNKPSTHYKLHENCNDHGEIITDGQPPNFPQSYNANRRQAMDIYSDSHPFSGQGDWVLLSTTKGYKYPPQKQRSLQIKPDSVGTHRSVRLTVLPPLKDSKINMTTSHGGLLQVESSFKTVEQSQQEFVKKQKLKQKQKQKKPHRSVQQSKPIAQIVAPNTRRNSATDTSSVLAAVGAGMIPATMAMLVPMAMGGRKRRQVPNLQPHRLMYKAIVA